MNYILNLFSVVGISLAAGGRLVSFVVFHFGSEVSFKIGVGLFGGWLLTPFFEGAGE